MTPGQFLFWRRERQMEVVLREVHAVLVVWAETWPDERVRQKLLQVLTR